jgi:transposase
VTVSLLPVRLDLRRRPTRKHRAVDEVDRQLFLRAGADLYIQGLHVQLADQEEQHAVVIARIEARHAETVRGLERELQEARERLAIACKAETAVTRTQELSVEEIRRHCTPVPLHQSPMAQTANPAHVPAWAVRD